jgi:PhnB protein
MAEVNPYFLFNGNCDEAFEFYRSVFGGEFAAQARYSDMPSDTPLSEDEAKKIMYVALPIGKGTVLMGSDCPGSQPPPIMGNNVMLAVSADTEDEGDRLFAALSVGGIQKMVMQDMFWGGYFGMLTDRFGINWQINYDRD